MSQSVVLSESSDDVNSLLSISPTILMDLENDLVRDELYESASETVSMCT